MINIKRIDAYLDKVYHDYYDSDALELRHEMRQHLLELVEELKLEGHNEYDAISLALEQFGDIKTLEKDVKCLLYKPNNNKCKIGITIGIVVFLSILGMVFCTYKSKKCTIKQSIEILKEEIFTNDKQLPLTDDDIKRIEEVIYAAQPFEITYLNIYKITDGDHNKVNQETIFNLNNLKNFDDKTLISVYKRGNPNNPENQSFVYNPKERNWYAEFEVSGWNRENVKYYYISQSALFLAFASCVCIFLNNRIGRNKLLNNKRHRN